MSAELLSAQVGDEAFRKLMASPVSAPRKRVRKAKVADVGDSIDATSCPLADVWRASRKGKTAPKVNRLTERVPTYAAWLRSFMSADDARREDARAKAEWAAINESRLMVELRERYGVQTRPHQGAREIARRKRRLGTPTVAPVIEESKKRAAVSKSSWPSFRPAQLDAIYATEGVQGLISVNATTAEIEARAGKYAEAA